MARSNELEVRKAQLSHFNKLLNKLDVEMLVLSREQTRQSVESRLHMQKKEFDRVGGDVIKALEKVESATFQTPLVNSSSEVLNQLEGVGAALVTASNNLNKAWVKHAEEEHDFHQARALTRRLVIRRKRQELWQEKCRVIDGEDAIRDRDITNWEAQCGNVQRATRSIEKEDERTLAPTLAETLKDASSATAFPPLPESPRSVEILSDIGAEISRLEADHEAAAQTLKAEKEAHALTAAQILDLESQVGLLEHTLASTNKELQLLKAERARAKSGKRRRQNQSEGDASEAISFHKAGPNGSAAERPYLEKEQLVVDGSELNELRMVAEELRKEKEAHAATAVRLTELQERFTPRGSSTSSDLKKYMLKLKPSKAGQDSLPLQTSLDESIKALEAEKQEHAVTIGKLKNIENETKLKEPLVEVGQRVRRKFLENSKRVYLNGSIVDIRGEADLTVIKAGGEAAYQGNAHADASLFSLGFLDQAKDKALFENLYACPLLSPPSRALQSRKLTELFNMRATMGYCSSFTQFSLSEEDDSRFQTLEAECIRILTELRKDTEDVDTSSKEAFETHPGVEAILVEMRSIVERILQLERRPSSVSDPR